MTPIPLVLASPRIQNCQALQLLEPFAGACQKLLWQTEIANSGQEDLDGRPKPFGCLPIYIATPASRRSNDACS